MASLKNTTITGTLSVSTPIPVSSGGTGSATAAGALTNLGAQATLVSGTNIKTVNSTSLLGSGNLSLGVSGLSDTSISSPLSGQVLSYDGVNWANVTFSALPSQSGQSGKYLTTDGSNASWATLNTSLYMNDDTIPVGSSQTIPTGKQIVVDHLDVQGTLDIQGTLATVTGGYLSQTTMKTQAITHTNGTNAMTIDSSGNVMLGSNYLTPYTGFKNRIINGDMRIDQRNAGASVTASDSYPVDRWKFEASQASKLTLQQNAGSVTSPAGFVNYLGTTSSSSYSIVSSDYFLVSQHIEGLNVADLGWGTANAQTVTLSFWVRSSLTGTFGGSLQNSNVTRSYPFTYTISSANTWEQKTVTIAGDTSGTWLTTNGVGIRLRFSLGVGSTNSGTAGAWAGANYYSATGATSVVGTNGATFYITGVQLEKGSTATSFDYRPYGTELALCQRYTYVMKPSSNYGKFAIANAIPSGGSNAVIYVPVQLRTTPTVTTSNIFTTIAGGGQTGISSITSVLMQSNAVDVIAASATYTANVNVFWQDAGSGNATMTFNSEL